MMVASGTSTPTSITVVATSNCVSPAAKRAMAASFSAPFMRPCTRSTLLPNFCAQFLEARLGGGEIDLFGVLDQRTDPVGALARVHRAADGVLDLLDAGERNGAGVDRLAAGRLLAQFGHVHVAEKSEHQRARDRRRREHQHVDRFAFLRQRQPLMHAEAVLLVDDGERQIVERDVFLKERMGADQQVDVAQRETIENAFALAAALAPGEDGDAHAGGLRQRRDGLQMLAGEDFGRRHEGGLAAGFDH